MSDNNNSDKKYDNFDDFMEAEKLMPLRPSCPDRNEDGGYGKGLDLPYIHPVVEEDTEPIFWNLFPEKNITCDKIRELFYFGDDNYEKAMGVCMLLTLVAVFNPIFLIMGAFTGTVLGGTRFGALIYLAFMFMLIMLFIISYCSIGSFIEKKFWLPAMGIVSALKLFPFSVARGDTILAVAMLLMIYLLFRMKRDRDRNKPKVVHLTPEIPKVGFENENHQYQECKEYKED
jgi:hypothetical protein